MKQIEIKCQFQKIEEDLIRSLLQTWKRRGSTLLQVGLHSCVTPDFFWDAGFDVCATDENLEKLNTSLVSTGPRVEYQFAKGQSLPFDDDSFDYAFLPCFEVVQSEMCDLAMQRSAFVYNNILIKERIVETCRVAQKGIILLFKNSFCVQNIFTESFLRLCLQQKFMPMGRRLNAYSLWRKFKKQYPASKIKAKSAFFLPKNLSFISSTPLGFYMGYCVTFNASVVTGLGVFSKVQKTEIVGESLINRVSHNRIK